MFFFFFLNAWLSTCLLRTDLMLHCGQTVIYVHRATSCKKGPELRDVADRMISLQRGGREGGRGGDREGGEYTRIGF